MGTSFCAATFQAAMHNSFPSRNMHSPPSLLGRREATKRTSFPPLAIHSVNKSVCSVCSVQLPTKTVKRHRLLHIRHNENCRCRRMGLIAWTDYLHNFGNKMAYLPFSFICKLPIASKVHPDGNCARKKDTRDSLCSNQKKVLLLCIRLLGKAHSISR